MLPNVPYVHPIQAGRALYNDLGIEGDNECDDNISALNQNFVELTALYYIWKKYNSKDIPYFGLCHYRRYPTLHLSLNRFKEVYFLKANHKTLDKIFTSKLENLIEDKLAQGYVILPKPHVMYRLKKWSVRQEYWKAHDKEAWFAMENAIKKLSPEYEEALDQFGFGLKISLYNIMIAKWEFWDGYLTWLFPILFEVKNNYQISEDPSQRRVFGFLSERLLNIYVIHQQNKNRQKVFYLPIAHLS
jgi:hypothetical protein